MYYIVSNDYLAHHGIKGQKWGIRRFQNADGSLTPAGRERYGTKSVVNRQGKGGLSHSQRAMASLLGLPIPYVGSEIINTIAKAHVNNLEKKMLENEKKGPKENFNYKKKKKESSIDADTSVINSGWGKAGTNNNCVYCSCAYEMRRRGYDVFAGLSAEGNNVSEKLKKFFPGCKEKRYIPSTFRPYELSFNKKENREKNEKIEKELLSYGDGARGQLSVAWGNGGKYSGSHSLSWEVKNGKVNIVDGQSGKVTNSLSKYCSTNRALLNSDPVGIVLSHTRLDNASVDMNAVTEALSDSRTKKW